MSISMHIQNLDKAYKKVLKILSGNEKVMRNKQKDLSVVTNGMTDNPNPILLPPPLFQSEAINRSKSCSLTIQC